MRGGHHYEYAAIARCSVRHADASAGTRSPSKSSSAPAIPRAAFPAPTIQMRSKSARSITGNLGRTGGGNSGNKRASVQANVPAHGARGIGGIERRTENGERGAAGLRFPIARAHGVRSGSSRMRATTFAGIVIARLDAIIGAGVIVAAAIRTGAACVRGRAPAGGASRERRAARSLRKGVSSQK